MSYAYENDEFRRCIGRAIVAASFGDNALTLSFADGDLRIYDDGQLCCESRYAVCDDDLSQFVGAQLSGVEVRDAIPLMTDHIEHEVQFLVLHTTCGDISIATHNEHNGYYSGFSLAFEFWPVKHPDGGSDA